MISEFTMTDHLFFAEGRGAQAPSKPIFMVLQIQGFLTSFDSSQNDEILNLNGVIVPKCDWMCKVKVELAKSSLFQKKWAKF